MRSSSAVEVQSSALLFSPLLDSGKLMSKWHMYTNPSTNPQTEQNLTHEHSCFVSFVLRLEQATSQSERLPWIGVFLIVAETICWFSFVWIILRFWEPAQLPLP